MVQLKERQRTRCRPQGRISIPHGTIKSILYLNKGRCFIKFQYLMVQLKEIIRLFAIWLRGFQYLMVQLKDLLPLLVLLLNKFQYLMVQLKVAVLQVFATFARFQYLMVQLKGSAEGDSCTACDYFNTSWYN